MQLNEKLRHFVAKNFLFDEKGFPFPDDTSFLAQGIVDSLGVLDLVEFVTQEFQITVEPAELTPENFDSIEAIARYVGRKQTGEKPCAA
jgi:acyl carrier protein